MDVCTPYTLPEIDFVGGATQKLSFNILSKGQEPLDMSACTANFSVGSYIDQNGPPLISKSMNITGNSVKNVLSVTLLPEDTVSISGKFIYQIAIKDSTGAVDIPNRGLMYIANNINKEFIK